MGSTRLPEKALIEVSGNVTAVEFLLERLHGVSESNFTVLCTTVLPEDDVLCRIAESHGVRFFRGSVEDKMDRWLGAASENQVEVFVTADGDDLLCDPTLVDEALRVMNSSDLDFLEAPDVPCGAFTYALRTAALETACRVKKTTDTEMMWVYFKETGLFRTGVLEKIDEDLRRPEFRMTLDYPEDLDFFRNVIGHFGGRTDPSLREIIAYLDNNPEVSAINSFRQADFLANQAQRTHLEV